MITLTIYRFRKRNGSFVRVIETLPRYRDGARMAYIEYLDNSLEPLRVYSRANPLLEKYKPKIDSALSQNIQSAMKTKKPQQPTTQATQAQKSMEDID